MPLVTYGHVWTCIKKFPNSNISNLKHIINIDPIRIPSSKLLFSIKIHNCTKWIIMMTDSLKYITFQCLPSCA